MTYDVCQLCGIPFSRQNAHRCPRCDQVHAQRWEDGVCTWCWAYRAEMQRKEPYGTRGRKTRPSRA